jgi:hypothetical protein
VEEHLWASEEYIFRINHQGNVKLKGTDDDKIKVTIQVETTSQTLANNVDISIINGNQITLTVCLNFTSKLITDG